MFYAPGKFRDEVALAYGIKLIGWPNGIEFTNLSALKKPTAKVRALLDAWAEGTMCWAWLTQDELIAAIFDVHSACPGPHFPNLTARAGRNDIGKRRPRAVDAERDKYPPRYVRNGAKSARYISGDMEERTLWPITTWAERIGMGTLGDVEAAEDTFGGVIGGVESPQLPPRRELHCELPEDPIEEF